MFFGLSEHVQVTLHTATHRYTPPHTYHCSDSYNHVLGMRRLFYTNAVAVWAYILGPHSDSLGESQLRRA